MKLLKHLYEKKEKKLFYFNFIIPFGMMEHFVCCGGKKHQTHQTLICKLDCTRVQIDTIDFIIIFSVYVYYILDL